MSLFLLYCIKENTVYLTLRFLKLVVGTQSLEMDTDLLD